MSDTTPQTYNLAPSAAQKFTTRVLPFLALAALMLMIPLFGPSRGTYTLINAIGINIVFALSYNMLLGQAGLLSFGHAVFFGLGGYAAIHAMGAIEEATYGAPGPWGAVPVAALPLIGFAGGALAGAILGWPSCRRAGTPFAMISLGIAELVAAAGFMFVSVFGGEEGITADRVSGPELFGMNLGPIEEVYWVIAFWTLIAAIAMFAFTRTPLGRLAQACRDNAERVMFIGYDSHKVRYVVYILAGGFAGLAGGMATINFEIVTPLTLGVIPSGLVLLMAYIGGARYFWGPALGAVVMTFAQSNLSDYTQEWLLYLGVLFIAIVIWAPSGLAGLLVGAVQGLRGADRSSWLARTGLKAICALAAFTGFVICIEVFMRWKKGLGEVFVPFGIALPPASILTWILGPVLLIAGIALLRHLSRSES